jgi:hypothetical protein
MCDIPLELQRRFRFVRARWLNAAGLVSLGRRDAGLMEAAPRP